MIIKTVHKQELEQLLLEMEPQEVSDQYGARFDDQARAFFESFQSVCQDLDSLSENYLALVPTMPQVPRPELVQPLFRRKVSLPVWSLPLAAAALFCLGFILAGGNFDEKESKFRESLVAQRQLAIPLSEQDSRLADAFLARAQAFQDRREFDRAWNDYNQVLRLLPNPSVQRDMVLSDMRILAEEQDDAAKLKALDDLVKFGPDSIFVKCLCPKGHNSQ